jgi:uncharacterized delta-60 repeat protein
MVVEDVEFSKESGSVFVCGGSGFNVAKFNTHGSLDSVFGYRSTTIGSVGTTARALFVDSNEGVLVAGETDNNFVALAKYTSSGLLDSSFGNGGVSTAAVGNQILVADMTVLSDGRILVLGSVVAIGGGRDIVLARFDATGNIDSSFAVVTDVANFDYGSGLVIQEDGKIVVAAYGLR